MTTFDTDEYTGDNDAVSYVTTPAATPDLAVAILDASRQKGCTTHISAVDTQDANRHDISRITTVTLVGHIATASRPVLPAVAFRAVFHVTYPAVVHGHVSQPIVTLTALDVEADDEVIEVCTTITTSNDTTLTPRVRGNADDAAQRFIALLIEQMERIDCMENDVPRDLTDKEIRTALSIAAATTGADITVHSVDFDLEYDATDSYRSPMTTVRGSIALSETDGAASRFTIAFDAYGSYTQDGDYAAPSTVTVHEMEIELLPRIDDPIYEAFTDCTMHITGTRDKVFTAVVTTFAGQIRNYRAHVAHLLNQKHT